MWLGGPGNVPRASIGLLIGAAVFGGFIAYVWLLKNAPASTVSTYAYVNPIVALFLGWTFNEEVITGRTLVAAAAIVVGVALMVSRPTAEPAPRREPALAEK